MGIEHGINSQDYFNNLLCDNGIKYEFVDSWYDYLINENKLELKSCRLTIRHIVRKKLAYRVGRFDFTNEENRQKQYDENIWVAFVIRHKKQFIFLGICQAKSLGKKRYISIHHTRKLDLLTLCEFKEIIQNENKNK